MNKLLVASLLVTTVVGFAPAAFAQEELDAILSQPVELPAASAIQPNTVVFGGIVDQPSLKNDKLRDSFRVAFASSRVRVDLAVWCQSARLNFGVIRQDEECGIKGNGYYNVPSRGGLNERARYSGKFVADKEGEVDPSTLIVSYMPIGPVVGFNSAFAGDVSMAPEIPSSGMNAFFDIIKDKIPEGDGAGELTNDKVDSILFQNFFVPSVAGLGNDKGCFITGEELFPYSAEIWFVSLTAKCTEAGADGKTAVEKSYTLAGTMSWASSPGVENQTQYNINLSLPAAGADTADAFAAPSGGADDFGAVADGISGTIIMAESSYTEVDGDMLPQKIVLSGSITGTNVSMTLVEAFALKISTFIKTYVGA
jgi:hypothetical protein